MTREPNRSSPRSKRRNPRHRTMRTSTRRPRSNRRPSSCTRFPPEDLSRSRAAWENYAATPLRGVTGEQIVSLAVKTGLDNSDLAVIWNISCTPGESELGVHDFALFMHF